MFDRLDAIVSAHEDLEAQMADPVIASDGQRYAKLARKHAELGAVVVPYKRYLELQDDLAAAREMADDGDGPDADAMATEAKAIAGQITKIEDELRMLLVPADPHDNRDVIVEIRSAAGGDEAGLFAGELRDMYVNYAHARGWSTELLEESSQGVGGIKEAVFEVHGNGAFAHFKHESGVHRVQRVPATESQGRIHTSTASVAVLPVADEVEVALDANDLKIDVFRSSGPGGQSVNTTDSAVRITHLPSGIVVSCQDQKSQHQNKDKAMEVLRSRLLHAKVEQAAQKRADARRGQIGTGDRSEKIRTYNFPQSRITDHRIGLTVHNLSAVLGGDLSELVARLREAERLARLEAELDDDSTTPGGGA